MDRLVLLGQENHAKGALADLLQQLVRPDHRAGALADRLLDGRGQGGRWRLVERVHGGASAQQPFDLGTKPRVSGASLLQKSGSLLRRVLLDRRQEDRFERIGRIAHDDRSRRTNTAPQTNAELAC
jgi:hypothetical protein